MGQQSLPRKAVRHRSVAALTLLLLAAAPSVARCASRLVDIQVLPQTEDRWVAQLAVEGERPRVLHRSLPGGRVVFDLEELVSDGSFVAREYAGHGVKRYRWSQLSWEPPVVRLVVELAPRWACGSTATPAGVQMTCRESLDVDGKGSEAALRGGEEAPPLAVVRNIPLYVPLAGIDVEEFFERSLGYMPEDVVKDGLPHFGAVRDDWKGSARQHQGFDIYVDGVDVLAAQSGTAVGLGEGQRAGGWVKIDHGGGVETVYVHVRQIRVRKGQRVMQGQKIARIAGAVGNAVEPQLHFEVKLDGVPQDPLPFFLEAASPQLRASLQAATGELIRRTEKRELLVAPFLQGTE